MKQEHAIRWLHDQLPAWVEQGVVSAETAEVLKRHVGTPEAKTGTPLALLFFGVLGSLLIGAGIILLLAHNWEELSRGWRTVISFLPLLVAQGLSGYVLVRRRSVVWREAVAGFHALSVGACIALIAQTYHMPGSFDSFMLTWMVLILPLVYLLQATVPLLMYFAGITAWAGYQQGMGGHALGFWPLAALAVPYCWQVIRADPLGPRAALIQWGAIVSFTCALGIVLEKNLPGLWIPAYACFFVGLYLAGGLGHRPDLSWWLQPARTFGANATVVLAFLLSWIWPWENVGWHYLRWREVHNPVAAWVDGVIGVGLVVVVISLWVSTVRRQRSNDLLLGSLAILSLVGYALAALSDPLIPVLIMNGYLLAVSLGLIVRGVRAVELRSFNSGMGIFSALVVARFFDSEFSFIAKGLVFIGLGVAFLVCNIWLSRRKEAES